jgi:hypothetical protein
MPVSTLESMRTLSLRFRINLVITLVIVAFTIATGNLLIEESRRSIREEMEAGTRITAQLLETVIANTRPNIQDASHNQILLSFLQRVGRGEQTRSGSTTTTTFSILRHRQSTSADAGHRSGSPNLSNPG